MSIKNNLLSIFNRKFFKHIIAAFIFVIVVPVLTIWILSIFTNHGQALSVPSFIGLTVKEAEKLAELKDMRIKVIDSVFNARGKKRGTIINQSPQRNFKVKENRRIFVTIKSLRAEVIEMPDFNNLTSVQLKEDIKTYGLRIEELIYKPSKYSNIVLEQHFNGKIIKPGVDIEKGSKITFVLGKSEDMKKSSMPMLIGLTKDEAEQKILGEMFNVGAIVYDETIISREDSLNAKVNKQRPLARKASKSGEEVDIWLSMLGDTIN